MSSATAERPDSLGKALPREMARVREALPHYDAIPTGVFAATLMRQSLDAAAAALASGDIEAMLYAYKDLQGYTD